MGRLYSIHVAFLALIVAILWTAAATGATDESSYGDAGDSYSDDTPAAETQGGNRYRDAPYKRMVNPGQRHGYTHPSTACATLVVVLPEPLNCSAVTDAFIASQSPDVCARVSCGTKGVLAGFSCTPGNGTLAGTQLTTSTGAQVVAGSAASTFVCALKRNADGSAWASMAATCCLPHGTSGGVSGSGATNSTSSLFGIDAAGNTTFGGCGGGGTGSGGGGGMRAAGCGGGGAGGGGGGI